MKPAIQSSLIDELAARVRAEFGAGDFIPLHDTRLGALEAEAVAEVLASGQVSTIGEAVSAFEQALAAVTGAPHAVATNSGTAALHTALMVAGVMPNDEVIIQSLAFIAPCNAIRYCQAHPVFVDVDEDTLGMSPASLAAWLEANAEVRGDGRCWNRFTGHIIRACVPVHTLGHPPRMDEIVAVCRQWRLRVVEDAAEAMGSRYQDRHAGRHGDIGVFSFNGNKTVTSAAGGALVTDDEELAARALHLTTLAKQDEPWHYRYDEIGYNYRMPALNAALGLAQLSRLEDFVERKRALAERYAEWFDGTPYRFLREPAQARSNYWYNAFLADGQATRDAFLEGLNAQGIMARAIWTPMHKLEFYRACARGDLPVTEDIFSRLVTIPSSVPPQ
ncbi:LegC family aminotransferase [Wenzhouxiangella marina]|uniref:DegT/DnrJ/EryC1/StrS aminotransferase n=1 Tax=Wenzhouxiangella marina TaxID=1579979 RepID=A0A0K0XYI5_9GAMM|nr:LegC family aminotransferase [Wenzhouxiangella marina]AKS42749.1 DegT/DnrJ/EryC1/StrS aminotransferase [Wenzhouxiangella marina]MBB6087575.1 aminotransferase in exopolysaccharide biosynthesis [Wenzhouxiangella marina]